MVSGPSTRQSAQVYQSNNTAVGPIGVFNIPSPDVDRWLRLIEHPAHGAHGQAIVALGRWLASHRLSIDVISGCELAAQLIGSEPAAQCENLLTLLSDGWQQSLGELLACARAL